MQKYDYKIEKYKIEDFNNENFAFKKNYNKIFNTYDEEYGYEEDEYGEEEFFAPSYAPPSPVDELRRQLRREQERNARLEGALHFERKATKMAEYHADDRLREMAYKMKKLQAEIDRRRTEDEDIERRKTEGARDFRGRAQRVRSIDLGDNDE